MVVLYISTELYDSRIANRSSKKSYALPTQTKELLIRTIFEVRTPFFTWTLLNNAPRDSQHYNKKMWTTITCKFLAQPENKELKEMILRAPKRDNGDICTVCRQVCRMTHEFVNQIIH